jgi:hypothetical protein
VTYDTGVSFLIEKDSSRQLQATGWMRNRRSITQTTVHVALWSIHCGKSPSLLILNLGVRNQGRLDALRF